MCFFLRRRPQNGNLTSISLLFLQDLLREFCLEKWSKGKRLAFYLLIFNARTPQSGRPFSPLLIHLRQLGDLLFLSIVIGVLLPQALVQHEPFLRELP